MREVVPAALAGERVDRVVAMLTGRSRAEVAGLVGAGAVRVAGVVTSSRSQRVSEGEEIEVDLPPAPAAEAPITADPTVPVVVIHDDDDVVVVDKPAGLVVHPGAGQAERTLVHGLLARYPEMAAVGEAHRPGIVHRLDKGTSGLMVAARSAAAHERLVAALAARQVERRYRALVWGEVAAPRGLIDAPIGRSARDPSRMTVTERGRPARTRYEVHAVHHDPVTVTEVECALETGRTHQIRVHLRSIGHPVVGDRSYGGDRQSLPLGRPFLHAAVLGFAHPSTGEAMRFGSDLPEELVELLARLG